MILNNIRPISPQKNSGSSNSSSFQQKEQEQSIYCQYSPKKKQGIDPTLFQKNRSKRGLSNSQKDSDELRKEQDLSSIQEVIQEKIKKSKKQLIRSESQQAIKRLIMKEKQEEIQKLIYQDIQLVKDPGLTIHGDKKIIERYKSNSKKQQQQQVQQYQSSQQPKQTVQKQIQQSFEKTQKKMPRYHYNSTQNIPIKNDFKLINNSINAKFDTNKVYTQDTYIKLKELIKKQSKNNSIDSKNRSKNNSNNNLVDENNQQIVDALIQEEGIEYLRKKIEEKSHIAFNQNQGYISKDLLTNSIQLKRSQQKQQQQNEDYATSPMEQKKKSAKRIYNSNNNSINKPNQNILKQVHYDNIIKDLKQDETDKKINQSYQNIKRDLIPKLELENSFKIQNNNQQQQQYQQQQKQQYQYQYQYSPQPQRVQQQQQEERQYGFDSTRYQYEIKSIGNSANSSMKSSKAPSRLEIDTSANYFLPNYNSKVNEYGNMVSSNYDVASNGMNGSGSSQQQQKSYSYQYQYYSQNPNNNNQLSSRKFQQNSERYTDID